MTLPRHHPPADGRDHGPTPERGPTPDHSPTPESGRAGQYSPAGEHGAIVVPYEDGPLILRGDFSLRSPDGTPIEPGRATVALCRCGKSAIKPFCDGTHKAIGFRAGSGRDTAAPRQAAGRGVERTIDRA